MHILFTRLAPVMALSLPLPALAQQSATPPHAKASAPALPYPSAFADYKPWQDIKPGNWRQLNDALTAVAGPAAGHAGHGTPKPAPQPAATGPTPAASTAKPGHHGHHHGHQPQGAKK